MSVVKTFMSETSVSQWDEPAGPRGPGERPEQFGGLVWVLLKKVDGGALWDPGSLERFVTSGFALKSQPESFVAHAKGWFLDLSESLLYKLK